MYWVGWDVETTGLDPDEHLITEIGAVVWDVERKAPVKLLSTLVDHSKDGAMDIPDEIVKITGITPEMIKLFGLHSEFVIARIYEFLAGVPELDGRYVFVAHNAPFDRAFLAKFMELNGYSRELFTDPTWVDTKVDLDYGPDQKVRSLGYLAADHGFLNPYPHRAVCDVLAMFKIVSMYDPDQILEWAKSPLRRLHAMVSFEDKEKAKALGYKWLPAKRTWEKEVKEIHLKQETDKALKAGFKTRLLLDA